MSEKKYSKVIANAIQNYLVEDDWRFSFNEERGLFHFGLSLRGKLKELKYVIDVKSDEYLVYAFSPIGADNEGEKVMGTMAEFICRANYGMKNGNFELDMRDGEIRFKTYVNCEGITPSAEIIRKSIGYPATMFEHYSEGILGIIFGGLTAEEAEEKCEIALEGLEASMETLKKSIAEKLGISLEELEAEMAAREVTAEALKAPEGKSKSGGDATSEGESKPSDVATTEGKSKSGAAAKGQIITDLFGKKGEAS